jgi:uncharacterized membrane protein YedE/YeeE
VKTIVAAALAGVLFAVGLLVSGMVMPAKVIGFLDVGGAWDPSLLFVMAAALAVYTPIARIVRQRPRPVLDTRFHMPTASAIDLPLVAGAAIFGVGWGLSGYCPGPAVVAAGAGASEVLVFLATMLAGMIAVRVTR